MEKQLKANSHGHFLKNRFLRNIFFMAVILTLTLPVSYVVLVHPAFTKLLIEDKVDDALSVAKHLSSYVPPEITNGRQNDLPVNFFSEAVAHKNDFGIIKLKVFSKSGEVIFSTDSTDVGTINRERYLHEVIEKAKPHAQLIPKHTKSLEGQTMPADVMETYVPLIKDDRVLGAFEIYYDITRREEQLHNLLLHSSATLTILGGGLLALILLVLFKEHRTFAQRERAEEQVRRAHDELEKRVEERTAQLVEANELLRQEIDERKRIEEALRNSEEKYRALINQASDAIVLSDAEGNVLDTNKKARELFGYSKDEFYQKHVTELHPGEELERTFTAFEESVQRGSGAINDTKILRKDGKTVPVDITGSVIQYGEHQIVQGFFRDITERKRTEEVVRNIAEGVSASTGEIFFQSLVRQLAQMLEMDYALVGELIDQKHEEVETVAVWARNDIVDNFTYELANTPCENVVGKSLCSFSNNVQEQFPHDQLLQEMNVQCYVGVPLFDSKDRPLGVMAVLDEEPLQNPELVESTLRVFASRASAELERRLAETVIRQAEEQYRLLVQNLPSIVYKGYRDWSVDFFDNKKIKSLLGYNLEDFTSRKMKWSDVIMKEDVEQASREFVRAMKGDRSYVREYRIKTKAGDILWIQDRGHIVCDETGEIEYLSGVFFDITNHKHTDEALRKSEKELRFLSTQLLEAQEKERARFARELHDGIGQALSTVKVRVETLAKIAKSGVSQVQVEDLENLVPMIRQTIEEIRNTSMDLRPSTLDSLGIVPTIDWFSREFKTTYPFIQIEKEIDIQETEVPDPLKIVIYRIVQEAFNNVGRHSGAQMMLVSLAKIGGEIILAVRDNGRGFDPEDLLSADTVERGFGITSMKERAELSGGSFSIESGIGKGTTVRATWPIK